MKKLDFCIFIIIALSISIVDCGAQDIDSANSNRIYEKEVQSLCKQILPAESNWGNFSICKNVFGTCMVQHIMNRDETVSEDLALTFVETCADIQIKSQQEYAKWRTRSGVDAKFKEYLSGVISMDKALKNKTMKMDAECRVSSKKEGYTNYVQLLDCVKNIH